MTSNKNNPANESISSDFPGPSTGPHAALAGPAPREQFLAQLFDLLWQLYRSRVTYVQSYEQVIQAAGGKFFNDHIAFRTFACQQPTTGIVSLSRLFEALGYRAAGNYHFEDKLLSATHFQHANPQFPKLFISELKTWELPQPERETVLRVLQSHRPAIADEVLAQLQQLDTSASPSPHLLKIVVDWFHQLPWKVPLQADLLALNKVSQYAAWVLVHGYNVNHFTSLVNSHGVSALDDLEKTTSALQAVGVPMKAEIEGEIGSKLRQTATEAVKIDVQLQDRQGNTTSIPWSYAYFELAQRDSWLDPTTGQSVRFEGFLGPQATNLFEMTRVK